MSDRPKFAQCLCPKRHAILALMFPASLSDEEALNLLKQAVLIAIHPERYGPLVVEELKAKGVPVPFNPWCGLCGAKPDSWAYEVGFMKAQDWDDALKQAKQSEADQRVTAELMKLLGIAYDSKGKWN